MKLLLDTHSFLWFIEGSARLSSTARALIEDLNNQRLLSMASLWEIAIKVSLGKLVIAQPFDVVVAQQVADNGVEVLNIAVEHVATVALLPYHHRDPFDRLLVAQSIVERVPLVSGDQAFDAYGIERLW